MLVVLNVLRQLHCNEARMMAAMIARRKLFAIDAGNLMRFRMIAVMNNAINARMLDRIAGLVFLGHDGPPLGKTEPGT